jgi:hypothetical protein
MRNGLEKQFISLKEIIDGNIETLGKLFTQSDQLADLSAKMVDIDNKELKKELDDSRSQINDSIKDLLTKTKSLFEIYKKLVDKIFR